MEADCCWNERYEHVGSRLASWQQGGGSASCGSSTAPAAASISHPPDLRYALPPVLQAAGREW